MISRTLATYWILLDSLDGVSEYSMPKSGALLASRVIPWICEPFSVTTQ